MNIKIRIYFNGFPNFPMPSPRLFCIPNATSSTCFNRSSGVPLPATNTCRTRKKKCDEARPHCLSCQKLGLNCEGYGVRLRWSGRAKPAVTFNHRSRTSNVRKSRSGSSPASSSQSPVSDVSASTRDALLMRYLDQETFSSLSQLERDALYECALTIENLYCNMANCNSC